MGDPLEPRADTSIDSSIRAFFRLVTLAESISFELWRTHGLTLGQVRLLQRIRSQAMVAGDLAKELGIRAASLTRMMERLESNGLVDRTLDREDRRRILVQITDQGRDTLGGIDFWRRGPVVAALEAMSQEERIQFTQTLECFMRQVRDQDEEMEPPTRTV